MATVVDALVVEVLLKAEALKKGAREAESSLSDVEKASEGTANALDKAGKALDKTGKDAEKAGKSNKEVAKSVKNTGEQLQKTGDVGARAFRSVSREALSFFAVLTLGKSLKAFAQENTLANVSLSNTARNLGTSTQSLATWQRAAQATGASAEDVSGSLGSLVSQFQTIDGRRNLGMAFGQMGVRLEDAHGRLRDFNSLLPDLARSAQRLGPQLFSTLGKQAGFSQGFINFLENGPEKIEKLYKVLKATSPTDRDLSASKQLQEDWVELSAQSDALGRSLMTDAEPALHAVLQEIIKLEKENPGLIKGVMEGTVAVGALGFAVTGLLTILGGYKFVRALANVEKLAKATGGVKAVAEGAEAAEGGAKAGGNVAETATKTAGAASAAGAGVKATEGATESVARVSRSARAIKFAGTALQTAFKTAGLAGDAYMVGDLFWNGAEPALSKDDTLHAKPYNGPFATDNDANFSTYAASVASIEHARYDQMGGSGNAYAGKYQMGKGAIEDAASVLHTRVPTKEEFLHNPKMQERFFRAYTKSNERALYLFSSRFRKMSDEQKLAVLAYAHNQGAGGARDWLNTGIAKKDGFGTYADRYSNLFLSNLKKSRDYVPDRPIIEPKENAPQQDYDQNSFSGAAVASIVRQKHPSPETPGDSRQLSYVQAIQKSMGTLDSLASAKGAGDTSNTITNNINIHAPNGDAKAIAREARNAFDSVTFRARQANIRLT
ncbi:hypothetical protein WSS15_23720 [Acetobacter pasteurianus]|uniref:hypothetical protein n=1 Tax=Acetobacter pasteurianus TaxID=438 RepID=UPI0022C7ACA4|nr:hypothetical protein [Acetobacter pasteurianus]GLH29722.1 hypothetical protein WSS15_23720 [Acetobacter pasteurianus]